MLVKESISFQRGADPKEILGIGSKLLNLKKYDIIEFDLRKSSAFANYGIIVNSQYENGEFFLEIAPFGLLDSAKTGVKYIKRGDEYATIKITKTLKEWNEDCYIKKIEDDTNESISFQRGSDPKEVLGIGEFNMYFDTKHTSDGMYYFTEKNNLVYPSRANFVYYPTPALNLRYTYSINKGNVYLKKPLNYASQELRSNSFAFTKGNPNKMAIPNDLTAAKDFILKHYLRLLKNK
jgi:hypothetical protein